MEGQIIEIGSEALPQFPRTISDAVILNGIMVLPNGTDINGKTLTEFINTFFIADDTFVFYHISDTHAQIDGTRKTAQLMEENSEARFTIITGDIQPHPDMLSIYQSKRYNYLTLIGNHDAKDSFPNNIAASETLVKNVCSHLVNMGSDNAGYWYQDFFTAKGSGIRFIAFDEYEHTLVNSTPSHAVAYTKTQMDWFINLLRTTPNDYKIVLCHHQPVSTNRNSNSTGLFISEKAPNIYEYMGGCDSQIIPKIVDAYTKRGIFSGTYNCAGSGSDTMTFNEDFSNCNPAKFLMHIGGHTHWDVVEFLPDFPNQLQVLIDRDGANKYTYSDLPRTSGTESAYCINKYTINMRTNNILIERIGAHITDSGANRDRINFNV